MKIGKLALGKKRMVDFSSYFLASIVQMIASLLLNPFIALNMSYNDYALTGYYASFNLLILPLVSFSFVQYYSKSYFSVTEEARQKLLNTVVSIQLLLGGIQLIIINVLFYFYLVKNNINFPFFPYAVLSFSAIFFNSFYSLYLVKLKFEKQGKKYLLISCVNTLLWLLFMSLYVIVLKLGALGYMFALFTGSVCIFIYSIKNLLHYFAIDRHILKSAFLFCWPIVLANMMEYVYTGIDRSFLAKYHDNVQLGLYNIAISMGTYVSVFYTALSQTFQPDIFEAVSQRNTNRVLKLAVMIQLLNTVAILIFILLAPFLVDLLTFGKYVGAVPYVRIVALKGISACLYFTISSIIIAGGFAKITLVNKIIGTIAVYFLFSILISRYQYIGAAWGQATAYLVMFFISLFFLIYKYKKTAL